FGFPEATFHQYKTLPHAVAEFLSHCVQYKPADRPQSFAEVLKTLDALQQAGSPAEKFLPAATAAPASGSRAGLPAEDEGTSRRGRSRRREESEDYEEDRSPHRRDDDERPRRSRRDDDEEDDRPRRSRRDDEDDDRSRKSGGGFRCRFCGSR